MGGGGTWQPIVTAPHDGTPLLVFGRFAGEINGPSTTPEIGIAAFSNGKSDFPGYDWLASGGDAYAVWWNPSHWQLLPAAPEAA